MRHTSKRKQLQHLIREMVMEETSLLNEKKIIHGQGKPYGQVVFYAGGAGSGKGFSLENFADFENYKIINVDDWKQMFIKSHRLKGKYPEIADWIDDKGDIKDGASTAKMHKFVKQFGLKRKQLRFMLQNADPRRLPNLLFDQTMKDLDTVNSLYIPSLLETGYDPRNIHVTWVLTDWEIAWKRNKERKRTVPKEIFMNTHVGAANTMLDILTRGLPRGIDGEFRIIFGNPEYTTFETDFTDRYRDYEDMSGEYPGPIDDRDPDDDDPLEKKWVSDFKYLKIKEAGKPIIRTDEFKRKVLHLIGRETGGSRAMGAPTLDLYGINDDMSDVEWHWG